MLATPLRAEVVQVPPGAGTLAAGGYGHAVIDKPLTIQGQDSVIDGGHKGTVLLVTADDVTLRWLQVQGLGARRNRIEGRQDPHMTARGNGFYVWNAPGVVIEDNTVRYGRDGIFSNASRKDTCRRNTFRDLRFAIHYM